MMHLLRLVAVLLLLALPATAQEAKAPDYAVWEREAQTVQQAVDDPAIGDDRLSQLRAEVVKWRNTFTEAQGVNADRIETVRGQIDALGPAPADGETEDPAIAARRAENLRRGRGAGAKRQGKDQGQKATHSRPFA